jgi:Cu2+-exporting ATPase
MNKALARAGAPAASRAGDLCAYCGDSLNAGPVVQRRVAGELHRYCCLGCAFIAEQLAIARNAQRDIAALQADERRRSDAATSGDAAASLSLPIDGMVCAACALLIESRLRAVPGVARAFVDFAARRVSLAFDPAQTSEAALRAALASWGYATDLTAAQRQRAARLDLARVLVAWLVMMQVMMLAFPAYVAAPGEIAPDVEQLLRIAQLVLTLPVVLFSAVPILRAALNQLRARAVGMDVPIVLGLGAAFAAGVWSTAAASGAVYFDSIAMFVALVLGSRWVQTRALARTQSVVAAAQEAAVLTARRLCAARSDGDAGATPYAACAAYEQVPAAALQAGDQVWVLAGETFPADGLIASGTSSVSQAWLMGEARPHAVQPGAGVLAGAINLEQPVTLEVTRAGDTTALAAVRRLAERAGQSRPRVVEAANRVATAFLWIVLFSAAAVALGWSRLEPQHLAQFALPNTIAVLIATCPCALSLAAPAAWSAAQSALARHGVLVARAAGLEALAQVDMLAMDKTGTLTAAEPHLRDIVPLDAGDRATADRVLVDRALVVAASLDSASTHPFARALARAASEAGLDVPLPLAAEVTPGRGVEATVWGQRYRLGAANYALHITGVERTRHAARLRAPLARAARAAQGVAVLADAQGPIAVLVFDESLREGAAPAAAALRTLGLTTLLLSGDRRNSVRGVARTLGFSAQQVHAELRPQDKRDLIAAWQRQGRRVAMLGDGLNDAPVLAQADVSLALGSALGGSALAQTRADFVLIGSDLRRVAEAVVIARRALRIVRQNFAWALAYNLSVLPLAAMGVLTPAWAAIGMAASSLLVVGNALRLLRSDAPGVASE